jgi:hypothetical protein
VDKEAGPRVLLKEVPEELEEAACAEEEELEMEMIAGALEDENAAVEECMSAESSGDE